MTASARSATALSPEFQLLLHTAGGADQDAAIADLLARSLDWSLLVDIAEAERATTPLLARVTALGATNIPAGVLQRWRRLSMISAFEQVQLQRRLHALLAALGPLAEQVVLLKGAALGTTVYARFVDRPMRDIDVLVPPDVAGEMRAVALQHGWRSTGADDTVYAGHQHSAPLVDAAGTQLQLELHTELLSAGNPFDFSAAGVTSRAVRAVVGESRCMVPSREDMMLHLAIHFAWSHKLAACAWRTFRDARMLVASGDFDWDAYIRLADEAGAASVSYWTLAMAKRFSGFDVPTAVLKHQRPNLLPGVVQLLTRHLAPAMSELGPQCPSDALSHRLWKTAMQLRDHVDPWEHDELFKPKVPATGDRRRAGARRFIVRSALLTRYMFRLLG